MVKLIFITLLLFTKTAFSSSVMQTFSYNSKASESYPHSYDLYLPKNANSKTPLFAFVHGGYWVEDDRSYGFGKKLARALNKEGFAVALLRYRLAPEHKHPVQMNDISLGFNRLLKQLDSSSYNANCIVAAGHSAGGHLISLMALDERYLSSFNLQSTQLKAVIALSGIFDLNDASGEVGTRIKNLYKRVFGESTQQLANASPISYVKNLSPELVLLTGEDDFPGFNSDAKIFYEALKSTTKSNVSYQKFSGRDHFKMVDMSFNQSQLIHLIKSKADCK